MKFKKTFGDVAIKGRSRLPTCKRNHPDLKKEDLISVLVVELQLSLTNNLKIM